MFYGYRGHDPEALFSAQEASREARSATTRTVSLEHEVERLLMITEALWLILKEEHGYDDDKLRQRVMEIDMRDGKLDGQVAATAPVQCPNCQRTLSKKRPRCIYCGAVAPPDLFAR